MQDAVEHPIQAESNSASPALWPSTFSIHIEDISSGLVKDCLHSSQAGILFLVSHDSVRAETDTLLTAQQQPDAVVAREASPQSSKILSRCVSAGQFDRRHLPSPAKGAVNGEDRPPRRLTATPEIVLVGAESPGEESANSLLRTKPFSHSTECVEPTSSTAGPNDTNRAGSFLSLSSTGSGGGGLPRASSETSLGSNQSAPSSDLKSSKSTEQPGGFLNMSAFRISAPQVSTFNFKNNILEAFINLARRFIFI